MKRNTFLALAGISSALLFTACNNGADTVRIAESDAAAFKEWKTEQEAKEKAAAAKKAAGKVSTYNTSGTYTSSTTNNAQVPQKKGWSKAAKYGVGGTVGGAVLGAVINKKDPVRGAVVGGVILGGGGYIYGRSQDKKDGRVQ